MPTIKTIYVDTGATGGANGTSWQDAYPSLRLAIAGESAPTPNVLTSSNLTTNDEVAKFLVNASTSAVETSTILLSIGTGFTTNNDNYIWIVAEDAHRANTLWSTSKYRIQSTGGSGVLQLARDVRLEGLQIEAARSGTSQYAIELIQGGNGTKREIIDCYLKRTNNPGGGQTSDHGVRINNNTEDLRITNSIIEGFDAAIRGVISRTAVPERNVRIYNCTFANNSYGINYDSYSPGDFVIKNTIFANCSIAGANGEFAYGTNYNSINSPSFGASFSVYGGDNDHDKVNQTFTFTNGFALTSTDTGARGGGVDLSNDPDFPITTDIENKTRTGVWDIGAYNINESVYVLTVGGERTISVNQQNVYANGAGLSGQTKFLIVGGTRELNCSIDSTSTSNIIFDVPDLSSTLTANIGFGKVFFKVNTLPVIQGTLNPPTGYNYHVVTDVSEASNTYCIYNGQSPAIAVGDQILYDNSEFVVINNKGFPSLSNNKTSFVYYIWDSSDETWGVAGAFSTKYISKNVRIYNRVV